MVAVALVQTRDRTWSPVLEGLHSQALDCIQTGLAALADHHHGTGTHLVLGAPLGFLATGGPAAAPAAGPVVGAAEPVVEPTTEQRLAEATALAGLRHTERRDGLDGPALRGFLAEVARPLYVVADAFDMPWVPYSGRVHMDHSVLLVPDGDRFVVVDPYHNDTQWGAARPGVWRLPAADLDAAVAHGASAIVVVAAPRPQPDPGAVLDGNAATLAAARGDVARYVAAARAALDRTDRMDQLVLDVWVLGRSRLLHSAWLATLPGLPESLVAEAAAVAQDWLRLAAQSYVAARRLRRGGALPASVVDRFEALLTGDADLAARLAREWRAVAEHHLPLTGRDEVAPGIREAVVAAVRMVLGVADEVARRPQPLRSLPDFNSFRLVAVIERVESLLGVELDAEDLTQDALHDVDSLAALFAVVVGRSR